MRALYLELQTCITSGLLGIATWISSCYITFSRCNTKYLMPPPKPAPLTVFCISEMGTLCFQWSTQIKKLGVKMQQATPKYATLAY